MTKHEAETLRIILGNGGKVRVTMGRLGPGRVRTTTVRTLMARGLLGVWGGGVMDTGGDHDLCPTAAGCRELDAFNYGR